MTDLKARRPTWRCLQACIYDRCTINCHHKPTACIFPGMANGAPIWMMYEGRKGQRHIEGGRY